MSSTTPRVTRRELGLEAHLEKMRERREQLGAFQDFTQGRGLELGPLDAAISDRSTDDVRYVDVHDRAGMQAHYRDDPDVLVDQIPEIDFPLIVDGHTRSIAEAAGHAAPYDWIIASHVIEHVPDVIGWLQQLADIAADGARLVLAVPDRRYSFDRHRPATTTGEALLAHELAERRPGTRALYDHFSAVVSVAPARLWQGKPIPGREATLGSPSDAMAQVRRGQAGEYVDCHVWTFGPGSFLDQIQEWRALGLADWHVETIRPQRHTVEFFAVLRRGNRDGSTLDTIEPVPTGLPGWLMDEAEPWLWRVRDLEAQVDRIRARAERQQRRIEELEGSVGRRIKAGIKRGLRR